MSDLLKHMYNEKFITELSKELKLIYPSFKASKFKKLVFEEDWDSKELKERMRHIAMSLHELLPADFKSSAKILVTLASTVKTNNFEMMILPDYIELYGRKHWNTSIKALEKITRIASAEFAVRPFIIQDVKKTMKQMNLWSKHKNHHVRRLASEGCRPRLPWAMALPVFKENPELILPILENLKDDTELYVRRSVANNLNDIAKDNPTIVINLLKRWNKVKTDERQWLIRHALRSLEKQAHPEALKILGFSNQIFIKVERFKINKKNIRMGEDLILDLSLSSSKKMNQALLIDYIIYHQKSNGAKKPKVFKWSKKEISREGPLILNKKHRFRIINTRRYYEGEHEVHIQVNGQIIAKSKFRLLL